MEGVGLSRPVLMSHAPSGARTSRQALSCSGATTKEGERRSERAQIGDVDRRARLMGEESDEDDEEPREEPVGVVEQRGKRAC